MQRAFCPVCSPFRVAVGSGREGAHPVPLAVGTPYREWVSPWDPMKVDTTTRWGQWWFRVVNWLHRRVGRPDGALRYDGTLLPDTADPLAGRCVHCVRAGRPGVPVFLTKEELAFSTT